MTTPVIPLGEAAAFPMQPDTPSDTFGAMVAPLSDLLGTPGLGAMYVRVEPGKRAFPFHNHLGNDEMFVVLEGEGTFRIGDESHAVKAGDLCVAPRGGPDTAHQLINTGSGPLAYLGLSTRNDPDVIEYPDTGKFAALAIAPGPSFMEAHLRFVGRAEDSGDYWEGEV